MAVQTPVTGKDIDHWPHVVVVGAGFGGLNVARHLKREKVRVTLVDRNNYHLFQPLLYQVATAGVSPDEIAYPARSIFRGYKNATFRMTEVTGVDYENRLLLTSTADIPFDYLVLAFGGQTNFFGLESVQRHGFELKGLDDATQLRSHILRMFEAAVQEEDPERRKAMLTFVVVGGGPTGVEFAGALSELIRMVLAREYLGLNINDVQVLLLEAADRLLLAMPEDLGHATAKILRERKHVDVRFGAQVVEYDGEQVRLKDGQTIASHTLMWAAGVRAAGLADALGLPQERGGRVRVQPTLQAEGHPEVFIIGDAAYLPGEDGQPLPMVAPVAIQQADHAAENILRLARGAPAEPFRYKDPGTMATIGRNQAVAQIGRWKFRGVLAWWAWLVVHLIQIIGFRNRLVVLINWVWDYVFYDRVARIIRR